MKELKQIVFTISNSQIKGADVYYNNGSTWLIFTDKKKWVFELTKEGTLWYNYYFFKNLFELLSLDVIENQNYITEWVDNFIQNGVKHTDACQIGTSTSIEDAIQNGVKQIHLGGRDRKIDEIKDIIENGVKETNMEEHHRLREVVQTVKNGIKNTINHPARPQEVVDNSIKNGIKQTKQEPSQRTWMSEHVVGNGIKETKYCELHSLMRADHIIKDGIKETWGYDKQPQIRVNEVMSGGIKETNWRRVDNHPSYLDNIIESNN